MTCAYLLVLAGVILLLTSVPRSADPLVPTTFVSVTCRGRLSWLWHLCSRVWAALLLLQRLTVVVSRAWMWLAAFGAIDR